MTASGASGFEHLLIEHCAETGAALTLGNHDSVDVEVVYTARFKVGVILTVVRGIRADRDDEPYEPAISLDPQSEVGEIDESSKSFRLGDRHRRGRRVVEHREGIGIGVIPPEVVRRDLEEGALRVIAPAPALPDIAFTATYASLPDSGLAAEAARLACEVAAAPDWRQ